MKKTELSAYDKLVKFEQLNPNIVKAYRWYITLSVPARAKLWAEWTEYYEKCAASPSAENFREQMQAFKDGNMSKVREMVEWAKQLREQEDSVRPPTGIDPYKINNIELIYTYKSLLSANEREKLFGTEATGVFDTRGGEM